MWTLHDPSAPSFSALPVTIQTGGIKDTRVRHVIMGSPFGILLGIALLGAANTWVNILGGVLILAMAYLIFRVLTTRRTVRIDQNEMHITTMRRGVTETLVEPVSAYRGVLVHTRKEPGDLVKHENHEVLLVHPDRKKTVLVYWTKGRRLDHPKGVASQVWAEASKALGLPQLTDRESID